MKNTSKVQATRTYCETEMAKGELVVVDKLSNFPCYFKNEKAVYFYSYYYDTIKTQTKDFHMDLLMIKGADPDSFQIIQNQDGERNDTYAKDRNFVYHQDYILEGADPETFQGVYYVDIDAGTYFLYFKDKNFVYNYGKRVEGAAPDSFQVLNAAYAKDKKGVYYFNGLRNIVLKVQGADPQTFQALDTYYAKDKNFAFKEGVALEGSDGSSFVFLDPPELISGTHSYYVPRYTSDKNFVYYHGDRISDDPLSFEILEVMYARDKKHVYCFGKILGEADPDSFRVYHENFLSYSNYWGVYGKDKNGVYRVEDCMPSI